MSVRQFLRSLGIIVLNATDDLREAEGKAAYGRSTYRPKCRQANETFTPDRGKDAVNE